MPGCLFMSSFEYPKVSLVGWVREQKSNPSPRVKLGILKTLSLRPQWRLATNGFFCGCSLSVDTQSGLPQALFYSSMVCSSQLVVVFYLAYFSSIHHFFFRPKCIFWHCGIQIFCPTLLGASVFMQLCFFSCNHTHTKWRSATYTYSTEQLKKEGNRRQDGQSLEAAS